MTLSTQATICGTSTWYNRSLPTSVTSAAVGTSDRAPSASHKPQSRMLGNVRPSTVLLMPYDRPCPKAESTSSEPAPDELRGFDDGGNAARQIAGAQQYDAAIGWLSVLRKS